MKTAYINVKNALEALKSKQAEWVGVELPVEEMTKTQKQKISVLKQLAEKREEEAEQQDGNKQAKNKEI